MSLINAVILSASLFTDATIGVEASIYTKHMPYESWMNENNNLIGLEYTEKDSRLSYNFSTYRNTYKEQSYTFGTSYTFYQKDYFAFDLMAGVVTGYDSEKFGTRCLFDDICTYLVPKITLFYPNKTSVTPKTSFQLFGKVFLWTIGFDFQLK